MKDKRQNIIKNEQGVALILTLMVTALLVAVITEVIYTVHLNTTTTELHKGSQEASLGAEGGVELALTFLTEETTRNGYTAFQSEEASHMVIPDASGVLILDAEDEQGKVPINNIVGPNGVKNEWYYDIYIRLLENLDLDESLAETLADWIDTNEFSRLGGAESAD
ncbi:MAG: general secretion pathway protein GspK, partial [Deltaproteobacteria bacterium]|nr:general secretion pathway protein GspK [Deltaproteobacteria bacterium]